MQLKHLFQLILLIAVSSFTSLGQHIELIADNVSLGSTVKLTSTGGIYTCSGLQISYLPAINSSKKEIITKQPKDHRYQLVKWDTKGTRFNAINYMVEGETLHCLGYVTDSKTKKVTVMRYSFDKQLNMINETVIAVSEHSEAKFCAFSNDDKTRSVLLGYEYKLADRKNKIYTQAIYYYHFDKELTLTASGTFALETPADITYNDLYRRSWEFYLSTQLLDDGTIAVNFDKHLYIGYYNEQELFPLKLELEKSITSYAFHERNDGTIRLVGGYEQGSECGVSVIDLNKDLSIKDQYYYPASIDFSKSYYELVYDQQNTPANERKTSEPINLFRPSLIKSAIDEDGTIHAAFFGVSYSATKFEGRMVETFLFRNNLLVVGIKNNELVYQQVIPYLYKEDKYASVGTHRMKVFFNEDDITVIYPDYSLNYDANHAFTPTTDKIPLAVKPIHALIRYDYKKSILNHKLLEVRTLNGITYNQKASYLDLTDVLLSDGSYLVGCDEWGVATLKHSYIGKLMIK